MSFDYFSKQRMQYILTKLKVIFDTKANIGDVVTGVKGDSESSYRKGNVNVTKSNIGLGNVGNFLAVSTAANQNLTNDQKSNARTNIGAGTSNLALGETSSTAYRGDRGKTAYDHSQVTSGNPHNVTKSDVGLGNVGNFKAVSTVASQGLTDTEKSNARTNIGAGTSNFSGAYADLTGKPTIPTVNNGTLTIQKNGTNVQTFTANQSGNATANITVPTKVSELSNDSGYTTNTGTITGIKMNGASKGTSGVVDLGTVITAHQDISGKVNKSGDTMTGLLTLAGNDLKLSTTGSSSDDSADIAWFYGNGQEKARLWTQNDYTAESGLNFRLYKKDGTSLFSGTIPLRNTWRGIQDNLTSSTITDQSLSAKQGYLLANGSARDSTKLPLTGGTITGNLNSKFSGIDAKQANNGVSSTQYPTTFSILDKNNLILTRKEAIVETNGNISAYWYVRNYNTEGTMVAQKGIRLTITKAGIISYTIDEPASFRSAIGLGNVGNFKAVSTVASQGLTDTEKSNARANIGAGTSSFSGNYNDLSNKPTIPTVNNGTLTIQKNGTTVATFTANQSSTATANITVPTKVSELTNDKNYRNAIVSRYQNTAKNDTWFALFSIKYSSYNYMSLRFIVKYGYYGQAECFACLRYTPTGIDGNSTTLKTIACGKDWENNIKLYQVDTNTIGVCAKAIGTSTYIGFEILDIQSEGNYLDASGIVVYNPFTELESEPTTFGVTRRITGIDNNTTYTFATGDSNGQIKVTPSGGTAQNISVKGLGTAAYTESSAYAAASHNHTINQVTWPGNQNLLTSATANNQEWSIDLGSSSYTGCYFHVWSGKNAKSILSCYNDDCSVVIPNGPLTVNNPLTLYREGTTANNYPAQLKFKLKDTTTGQTYDNAYIAAYQDHQSTTYGTNMVIHSGGGMFLGSGESPAAHYAAKGASYAGEDTFITADGTLHLQSNGNSIANRVGFVVNTSGYLIPEKADTVTNGIGGLGNSSCRVKDIYSQSFNNLITGSGTTAQDKGSGVSPRYFPAKWTFNIGRAPVDGDIITIKIPCAGHDYGVFVSINNGTNYHPVRKDYGTGRLTTHFGSGQYITLIYTPNATCNSIYAVAGADARSNITGCWTVLNWYDSNNVWGYCGTGAATAAKYVDMTNYKLTPNSYINIVLVNTNTAASALTLNINGQGAKPIYINGTASSSSNYTLPNGTYLVYYNGTNYYFRTDGKITGAGIVDIGGNTGKFLRGDGTWQTVITSHQDISGKADKSATVSTVAWDSTNKKITKTINGNTSDVVTAATILGNLTKAQVTTALGYTPPTSDTNTHRPIQVNDTEVLGNNTTALNLKAGNNITLSNSSGTVTIAATGGSGTVTKVTAGTGLTGGDITTTGTIALATSGATAGSYGPSAAVTGNDGTTMNVPYITVDAYGRVTSISNKVYTSKNTWRGVQNNLTSTATDQSLSAAQGKALNDKINNWTTAQTLSEGTTSVTFTGLNSSYAYSLYSETADGTPVYVTKSVASGTQITYTLVAITAAQAGTSGTGCKVKLKCLY